MSLSLNKVGIMVGVLLLTFLLVNSVSAIDCPDEFGPDVFLKWEVVEAEAGPDGYAASLRNTNALCHGSIKFVLALFRGPTAHLMAWAYLDENREFQYYAWRGADYEHFSLDGSAQDVAAKEVLTRHLLELEEKF